MPNQERPRRVRQVRAVIAPGEPVEVILEAPPIKAGSRLRITGEIQLAPATTPSNDKVRELRRAIRQLVRSSIELINYAESGEAADEEILIDRKGDQMAAVVKKLRAAPIPIADRTALFLEETRKTLSNPRLSLAPEQIEDHTNKLYEELVEMDKTLPGKLPKSK